ncbi:ATP-binding cassette domain-containing protein [Lacisediminihabitans sp.]|uniref:ATP-binding cassette domain-containing protein n=1 Tax=Lacisediminihabitans sp. TaxID=2787631 RepID=UPI00374D631A
MDTHHPAITVRGLAKSYRGVPVLADLDITVGRGEIFAMLGPNGAGKTTTVNVLTTLVSPDRGTVTIAGHDLTSDPAGVRSAIGLTGQFAAVDLFQTGAENLAMMCRLAHLSRRDRRIRTSQLLDQFDLVAAAGRAVSTYSGGMRRRLDLAISLITAPPVVFLDEPTTGLDPRSRVQPWDVVRDLANRGTTILLTTQHLEEADQLADRIAVLDGGRIVAEGTPAELKARLSGDHVELVFGDAANFELASRLDFGASAALDAGNRTLRAPAPDPVATIRRLLGIAADHNLAVTAIHVVTPTLDDVFLSLTGSVVSTDREVAA